MAGRVQRGDDARALLIAEDHSYTFKTVEMPHKRDAVGRVYDPNPHLPYGPEVRRA